MSDDLKLPEELRNLLDNLRKLHFKLREHRWKKWRRIDPFAEEILDRNEKGQYLTGNNTVIHDSVVVSGQVTIGSNTHVGQFCNLNGGGGLEIGDYCSISAGVRIMSHDTVKWALSGGKFEYEYSPVVIENCCFIGTNTIITKGVHIGAHCLVGAGAVVTSSLPANSIALGVPAKVIGKVVITGDKVEFEYF